MPHPTWGKRLRLSRPCEVDADTQATHQNVPMPASQGNPGMVSIDVNALSVSTVVAQAVQSMLSQDNITAILMPRSTDRHGCTEQAVAIATDDIVVDSGSSLGHKVQGNITGRG